MNDEHEVDPDDVASDPEQDARIRALLAELGSGPDGEPIPPEVEARLDDTLALLVAQRGGAAGGEGPLEDESTSDNVVPMRRRWLPRAGVAAAAVIVLGVGGLAVGSSGLFDNSSQTSGSSSADSAGESAGKAPESSADSSTGSDSSTAAAALPELSSSSFPSDVASLLKGRTRVLTPQDKGKGKASGEQSPPKSRENAKSAAPGASASEACPGPRPTDGAVPNQVRYDGRRAVLLIHPERAGQQVVEAWSCAGDRRLATTTITP
jgi:hypothetical protein